MASFTSCVFFVSVFCSVDSTFQVIHASKKKCSFLKSLVDETCANHKVKNGISISVDKEQCLATWKTHTIKEKGCKTKTIVIKGCKGQCNSAWFPSLKIGYSGCSGCFPTKLDMIYVNLDCPGRDKKIMFKKVPMVKSCKCQSFKCEPMSKVVVKKIERFKKLNDAP